MVDEIVAKVRLDMSEYDKDIAEAKSKGNKLIDDLEKKDPFSKSTTGAKSLNTELNNLDSTGKKTSSTFGDMFKSMTASTIVVGAIAGITSVISSMSSKIVEVTAKYQKFEAVLTNTLGSKSEAQKAMKQILDFAAKTPFQVDELTDSFVKFANRGIKLTISEMTKLGDIASSQGKSFNQLTEAVLDAQTGEFERLKEFGIRASKEGDKVTLSFKGVTKEVANNEQSIKNAIVAYGDLNGVAGGMEAISRTIGGQLSNLQDNLDSLFKAIGDRTSEYTSNAISSFNSLISTVKEFVEIPMSEKVAQEKYELNGLVTAIRDVNTTNEVRSELITELNNKYPDFTKLVDISKASDEDLAKALAITNKEYDKRIYLLATSEVQAKYTKDILETIQAESELQKKITENENKLKNRSAASRSLSGGADSERAANEVFKREQSRIREKRKQLKIDLDNAKKAISETAKANGINTSEADKAELESKTKTSIQKRELTDKEKAALEKAAKAAEKIKLDAEKAAEKYAKDLEKFNLEQFEKEAKAKQDLYDATLTQEKIEKRAVEEKYFNLIETAKQYNLDTTALEAKKTAELKTINDKYRKEENDAEQKQFDYQNEVDRKSYKNFKEAEDKKIKESLDKQKKLIDDLSVFAANGLLLQIGLNPSDVERVKLTIENFNKTLNKKDKKPGEELLAGAEVAAAAYQTVSSAIFNADTQKREQELAALQTQKDEELRLAGDNEQKKDIIRQKYALKEREIKRKQAEADKKRAIFDAIVKTSVAIIQGFISGGPIGAIIAGALGAAQIALITATPIPKFAKGVVSFDGKGGIVQGVGTGTSDSNLAYLSKGESVIPHESTSANLGLINELVNGDVDSYINRHYVMPALQAKESKANENRQRNIIESENSLIARVSSHTLKSIHREQKNTTEAIKRLDKKDFKW